MGVIWHFIRNYWLYLVSLGMLIRMGMYWVDVRHCARMAKAEREACERLYKLVDEWADQWIKDRKKAFDDRRALDIKFLRELDARFGTNEAKAFDPGKPS